MIDNLQVSATNALILVILKMEIEWLIIDDEWCGPLVVGYNAVTRRWEI